MNVKSIFASKTFWVNLLGGLASVAATSTGYLPAKYTPVVLAIGSGANIVLRLVTNQGVTMTGGQS